LHEDQKRRAAMKMSGTIDQIVAGTDSTKVHMKLLAACQQAERLDAADRSKHLRDTVAGLLQE
jgi:hypothetical protein